MRSDGSDCQFACHNLGKKIGKHAEEGEEFAVTSIHSQMTGSWSEAVHRPPDLLISSRDSFNSPPLSLKDLFGIHWSVRPASLDQPLWSWIAFHSRFLVSPYF